MSGVEKHSEDDAEPPLGIGIIAPSDRLDDEDRKGLDASIRVMEQWGWKVKTLRDFKDDGDGFRAGTAKVRTNEVIEMLKDPDVGVIGVASGGYGLADVLMGLRTYLERNNVGNKTIVGYSDACLLLAALYWAGARAITGPNLSGLTTDWDEKTVRMFRQVIEGSECEGIPASEEFKVIVPGKCEGLVEEMNLETLILATGTWFDPLAFANKPIVLGIEDTGLQKSELERWLYMLANCHGWNRVSGVLIGRLNRLKPDDYPEWANRTSKEEIITKWAKNLPEKVPVAICESFGHRNQEKERERFYPLEWGRWAELTVSESGCSLKYLR